MIPTALWYPSLTLPRYPAFLVGSTHLSKVWSGKREVPLFSEGGSAEQGGERPHSENLSVWIPSLAIAQLQGCGKLLSLSGEQLC